MRSRSRAVADMDRVLQCCTTCIITISLKDFFTMHIRMRHKSLMAAQHHHAGRMN